MTNLHRIADICREQAARMRGAIGRMEGGKMWTAGICNGQRVDTTVQTIAEYSTAVAELEACAAKIEAPIA